jgi:hypothetical protein
MGRPGLSLDRKFKRLARALDDIQAGFGEMLARGALELLWDSAYESCEDYVGDVDDVEAQAHWRGKRGTLLAGLLGAGGDGRCGFIEEGGSEWWPEGKPGTFRIHDLWDHAPEYASRRAEREAAREAAGTTLTAIRSAAGKKGRATQLGQKKANGEQTADHGPANGEQTDAACSGEAGKTRAKVATPTPTPAPTPTPTPAPEQQQPAAAPVSFPGRDQVFREKYPATAAVIDASGGQFAFPAAAETRATIEWGLATTGVERGLAAARRSYARTPKEHLGWHKDAILAEAAAPETPPAPQLFVLDLSWIDQLPEPRRAAARAAWSAKQAEVEITFDASAVPRILASSAEALRLDLTRQPKEAAL